MAGVERWEVDEDGVSVGLQVTRPRLLPWLRLVRAPRFGRGLPLDAVERVVAALKALARERPVLRLHLEIWSEREEERRRVAEACRTRGFEVSPSPRSYRRTLWMDLTPPEEEIMAEFHATGRRHIRAPGKKGYEVRPITDPDASATMEDIFRATFSRTGGTPPEVDWAWTIRTNGESGAPLHLVGLFPEDAPDTSEPLSFALALLHGEVAEYAHAGSIRDRSLKIPLLYAPTWELMRWARQQGARYWDFGGVTEESVENSDPRGGINDFKRYFGKAVRTVGEEWVLKPRPRLEAVTGTLARWLG
jgi:hypothetical protein